jgi:hypothetical protein
LQTSNKLRSNQQGFSPIIGIIAIVIVIGLAVGGWYVMQKQDGDKKNHNQTNSQTDAQKDKEKGTTDKIADPSEDGKYLVIKEWSIQITLPDNLRDDISYNVNQNSLDGEPQIIFFSKRITESNLMCADTSVDDKKIVTGFYRYEVGSGIEQIDPPAFKTVAGFQYYWRGSSCKEALDRGEGNAALKQVVIDLEEAITNTLQPLN